MLYLTCTTITSVDLAHYGVSSAKDWVFVNCGTTAFENSHCLLSIRSLIITDLIIDDDTFRFPLKI